jgi:hypothetical protein
MNQKLGARIIGVLDRIENHPNIYKIKPTGCQKDKLVIDIWMNN